MTKKGYANFEFARYFAKFKPALPHHSSPQPQTTHQSKYHVRTLQTYTFSRLVPSRGQHFHDRRTSSDGGCFGYSGSIFGAYFSRTQERRDLRGFQTRFKTDSFREFRLFRHGVEFSTTTPSLPFCGPHWFRQRCSVLTEWQIVGLGLGRSYRSLVETQRSR